MPRIATIRVQNVRIHTDYTLQVQPSTTVITGPNGSGKTSLIEALYIALRGTSFKGGDDTILRTAAPWYRIDVSCDDSTRRTVKFDPNRATGRKQFMIDNTTRYRLSPLHKYPVVLFEPEDLRLLSGSPVRRRQFIDRFIAQLDPQYATSLRRYDRALRQRNSLLKQLSASDSLFAWDVGLSEYGAYIIQQRIRFCDMLNAQLGDVYRSIARTSDTVAIRYSHKATGGDIAGTLLGELHARAERDKLLGYTSVGPHRHDVLFDFNASPALSVVSRGEARTIVLALKFLEVGLIESLTQKKPIILLDDVFSELDEERQKYLIEATESHQIIMTAATSNPYLGSDVVTQL
jgi:DNA replication and repair protein RecF